MWRNYASKHRAVARDADRVGNGSGEIAREGWDPRDPRGASGLSSRLWST
jgi:hypothetical protein